MNYEADDIPLKHIMLEKSMEDKSYPIQQKELDNTIHNALGIGPMMDPLI